MSGRKPDKKYYKCGKEATTHSRRKNYDSTTQHDSP